MSAWLATSSTPGVRYLAMFGIFHFSVLLLSEGYRCLIPRGKTAGV